MTTQDDRPKRWWARFSVRTLIALVTLVCLYLACWRFTATAGTVDVIHHVYGDDAVQLNDFDLGCWTPMPMIVRLDEPMPIGPSSILYVRRYYLWYFTGAVRLPFQGEDPSLPVG